MPKLTKDDLIYKDEYVDTAKDVSDDPKKIFADGKLLSRKEVYEVLYFLNALTGEKGGDLDKKTRRICEWMLHEKVPTNIHSTLKIRTWIAENFAKVSKDYPFSY